MSIFDCDCQVHEVHLVTRVFKFQCQPEECIHRLLEFIPYLGIDLGVGVGYPNTKYIVDKSFIEYDMFVVFW